MYVQDRVFSHAIDAWKRTIFDSVNDVAGTLVVKETGEL